MSCTAEGFRCIYNLNSDRRRKKNIDELPALRQTLLFTVAKLRSASLDDVKSFILKIRRLKTNQEGELFLIEESRTTESNGDMKGVK